MHISVLALIYGKKNIVSSLPEKFSEDVNLSLCLECFCLRLSARGIGGGEGRGGDRGRRKVFCC